jgi:F-box interacting protein
MHHDNSRERRLLLQIWNCRTNYLDYYLRDTPNENGEAVFPPFHEPYGFSKMIDCCNGLVCFRTYHYEIVIWNPSIRKYKLLPSSVYAGSPRRNLGFGYDPDNNDHKFVSIDCFGSPDVCFAVEVYSLKANSWSDVDDNNVRRYCLNSRIYFGPVYLNGALYYLVETGIVVTVIRLLSFHLTTERFQEQTPALPVGPKTLEVLGGSLYVSTYERGAPAIVLWLMKERSWIPFRSVPIFEFDFQLEMPLRGWRVVLWSKDGQELLMEMDYGCEQILFKYDIKEKTRFIGHVGKEFWLGFCVGSLLLLDGDSVH